MAEKFQQIDTIIASIATLSNRTFNNILNHYNRQHSKERGSMYWNIYQKYRKANMQEEMERVGKAAATAGECFSAFKKAHKDRWEDILTVYDELDALSNIKDTNQKRKAGFLKTVNKFSSIAATASKLFGFESVICVAGNLLNADKKHLKTLELPGAQNASLV
ncbi:hypothetical protein FA15DRAFT_607253 [Coprinopsis marcescibilis]|uniref:Uncharacterized protein n=1 Tax=Coprinopsis marcescibilis TaxID=230819 RepID=A0A5C3K8S5_COPMA|nr:hypothetical protein FA15DRAFT_607253 [Coprinopsis marcescibilis]